MLSLLASLVLVASPAVIATCQNGASASSFKIDVHSHVVPDVYREALIENGYPVEDGTVYTDGFPVPDWDLATHISAMDSEGVNYSTLSISAPGVNFLAAQPTTAAQLARKLNLIMYNYTKQYPKRLGAMCILPLPDVDAALTEIAYCLDTLDFDGVGLYTNANGTYLGDAKLNPVFELLNNHSATVFVHPAAPTCTSVSLGYPIPMSEYPFDSVRAMENLLLTGQRENYTNINIIFPHGGGAMPYLATRIAGMASLSFLGSKAVATSLAQFKGYLFDTASATSAAQLLAMTEFFGDASHIVTGTDYPYVPEAQALSGLQAIQSNGGFTDTEMAQIDYQNALDIFPAVATKLGLCAST